LAGGVTISIGHLRDALFILAAVVVNAALGFYQEYKAEKALSELKTYLKQRSRIVRAGVEREADAAALVPGDIVRLSQGDRVPADGRLVFANDLLVDEAVLTGESMPVAKSSDALPEETALADQHSMVFAGTLVTQGVGTAIICRTNLTTELGKIAELVAGAGREETPLQKAIKRFSVRLGVFLGILTALIFCIGIIVGYAPAEMFLTSVAIAVSAVPEGLPVALTVILAIGVQRMARRKGVVRKMIAAEALGSATVIMIDKTGTLTMAKMALGSILPERGTDKDRLFELALINTNVLIENRVDPVAEWRMSGRTIEMALVRSAAAMGIDVDAAKSRFAVVDSFPFNAINKFSVSSVEERGKRFMVFLGAPDILIAHSSLDRERQKIALESVGALAASGELVVGVAINKDLPDGLPLKDFKPSTLDFQGLITLRDPVRPKVTDAIRRVAAAGIRTLIVTGDHRGTAEAVAKAVGIDVGPGGSIDSSELHGLSDDELRERLPAFRVISRVTPLDKMRVVKLLQEAGEVVAMTGDGVNDAPGIKQADIGIAMGSGTEVARDVADLVLLDDNFETIAAAVEEGRQIRNNIRKVLVYLLSSVADELFLIGGSLVLSLPLPLNALQILWVNFFSDSFPAVAFAFEKEGGGKTHRPRDGKTALFDPLMKFLILFIGLFTSASLFLLYWVMLRKGLPDDLVRTFIFASFGSYTLFMTFSVRNLEKSIFRYSAFSNRYMLGGVGIGVFLMASAIYIPFLQSVLKTAPLPLLWVMGVLAISALNMIAVESAKLIFRRRAMRAKK